MKKLTITARILPDARTVTVIGRDAWALQNLYRAGKAGCTPIDHPGPRWSHYVFKLRGFGFVIETINEMHGGPFAGHHARYVLRSDVQLLDEQGVAGMSAADPSPEVTAAALWLASQKEPPGRVVPALRERFSLTAMEACQACALAPQYRFQEGRTHA